MFRIIMNTKEKIHDILFGKREVYPLDKVLKIGKKTPVEIHIEKRRGSPMRWNPDCIADFDYGEIPSMINAADNMPWDIIVAPSSSDTDKNLLISGIVKVAKDALDIPPPHGNKPGNDKLILSKNGKLTNDDKKNIIKYFKDNKAFDPPKFF